MSDAVFLVQREPHFQLDGDLVLVEVKSGSESRCYAMPIHVLRETVRCANRTLDEYAETHGGRVVPIKKGRPSKH